MIFLDQIRYLFFLIFPLFSLAFANVNIGINITPGSVLLIIFTILWLVGGDDSRFLTTTEMFLFLVVGQFYCILVLTELVANDPLSLFNFIKPLVAFSLVCSFLLVLQTLSFVKLIQMVKASVLVSVALGIFFAIWYLLIFQQSYIGTDLNDIGRYGKNQFGYFLARMLVLYLFVKFLADEMRFSDQILVLALFAIILGTASRGAFVVSLMGLTGFTLLSMVRDGLNKRLVAIIALPIAVLTLILMLPNLEVGQRLMSLYSPELVAPSLGGNSASVRGSRILEGLHVFEVSPVFGSGSGFYVAHELAGRVHNDWVTVLAGHGIIGFTSYFAMYLGFFWVGLSSLICVVDTHDAKRRVLNFVGFTLVIISDVLVSSIYDKYDGFVHLFFILIGIYALSRCYEVTGVEES